MIDARKLQRFKLAKAMYPGIDFRLWPPKSRRHTIPAASARQQRVSA